MRRKIIRYKNYKKIVSEFEKKIVGKKRLFVFPYYHMGGAERVHLDIVKLFPKETSLCLFTQSSTSDVFYKEFLEHSDILDLSSLKINTFYKKKVIKKISHSINNLNTKFSIFSCNTIFFYEMLPLLKESVRKFDLTHAFINESENDFEKLTLPYVSYLDKRIVLGQKTKNDFINLYKERSVSQLFVSRIEIIRNKIEVDRSLANRKEKKGKQVLFVGRNSYEKRFHIFLEIAKCFEQIDNSVRFVVVGPFDSEDYKEYSNIFFTGELQKKDEVYMHYQESDFLLVTSSREGLPMVILEAMACGVVPISTDVGEIPELINNTTNCGVLIDNTLSEKDLVMEFMNVLLSFFKKEEKQMSMSKNAVNIVLEKYSQNSFKTKYLELFKN